MYLFIFGVSGCLLTTCASSAGENLWELVLSVYHVPSMESSLIIRIDGRLLQSLLSHPKRIPPI